MPVIVLTMPLGQPVFNSVAVELVQRGRTKALAGKWTPENHWPLWDHVLSLWETGSSFSDLLLCIRGDVISREGRFVHWEDSSLFKIIFFVLSQTFHQLERSPYPRISYTGSPTWMSALSIKIPGYCSWNSAPSFITLLVNQGSWSPTASSLSRWSPSFLFTLILTTSQHIQGTFWATCLCSGQKFPC